MAQIGYENIELPQGSGKFLSLRNVGDQVTVRLVTDIIQQNKHWIESAGGKKMPVICTAPSQKEQKEGKANNCKYCGVDVDPENRIKTTAEFGWVVIDRKDGNKVKFFSTFSTTIAKDIMRLNNDPDWGDPKSFDVRFEKTDGTGSDVYKTIALRNSDPLTEEEKSAIAKANIDPVKELMGEISADSNDVLAEDLKEEDLPF